ncbi:MAG: tetratricopeptide repeat protein [Ginsengibacter sp.]
MKKIVLAAYCFSIFTTAFTQDAKTYYKQGFEKEQGKQFTEAINLFDKAIELDRQLIGASFLEMPWLISAKQLR